MLAKGAFSNQRRYVGAAQRPECKTGIFSGNIEYRWQLPDDEKAIETPKSADDHSHLGLAVETTLQMRVPTACCALLQRQIPDRGKRGVTAENLSIVLPGGRTRQFFREPRQLWLPLQHCGNFNAGVF